MPIYSDPVLVKWRLGDIVDDLLCALRYHTGNHDEIADHEREAVSELVQRRYDALKAKEQK